MQLDLQHVSRDGMKNKERMRQPLTDKSLAARANFQSVSSFFLSLIQTLFFKKAEASEEMKNTKDFLHYQAGRRELLEISGTLNLAEYTAFRVVKGKSPSSFYI